MKSRNFLHSTPIENQDSATKGFLLARSPQGDVAASSAVRRFELQHNSSPRFARRRKERRQGQALLLAVLIMLIAALLSAGFLGVVSGNLNQSARIADKTRAIEASRAGIAFANAQLSGSSQGDLWRPIDVSPAPNTTDAAYNFYYSQLEKVQGWAAKRQPQRGDFAAGASGDEPFRLAKQNYFDTTYGKFPDPNQIAGDAPKFLVKVREVPSNIADPDYEADHVGEIKITSIGLSEDDPNVFHRSVAYKVGRAKSPWASALRSVSNWNFDSNNGSIGVPFGRVDADAATGASVATPATNVDVQIETRIGNENIPRFSKRDVPFNIVIVRRDVSNPLNSNVWGAVVTDVTPPATNSTIATLKLARLEQPITKNDVIQKAAAIGVGSTIDLLNAGTPVPYSKDIVQPNGILTNGSVWLQGQIQLSDLRKDGTKLISSGSIAIDDNASKNKQVMESGDVGPTNSMDPNSNKLVPSSNANFPGDIVLTAAAVSDGVKKIDLITDGWNKISSPNPLGLNYAGNRPRTTEPFKPAKLDSAQNVARYRALTRNSAEGVYIDNRDDVEKVGAAAMSQTQLIEMWNSVRPISPNTPANYTRDGAPSGTSLEERHLRGWIGPDEFMARGALIELIQPAGENPSIRVTYDARSDAAPNGNPNGPDANKAFRDTNGVLLPGVYSRKLPWPKNGTLFAEGNIRIRGKVNLSNLIAATDAADFPSLTVVSMNNIYIEGGVSVDNSTIGVNPDPARKKLMLLAKKNVIVNPTRLVLGHIDAQTVSTNNAPIAVTGAVPNQSVVIPVNDASDFKVGDVIETYDTAATLGVRGVVSARDTTVNPNTLTASIIDGATVAGPSSVKTLLNDKIGAVTATGGTAPTKFFTADSKNAIERRVLLQNATAQYPNLRLTLDHLAKRDNAFKIETEASGADGNGSYPKPTDLTVKVVNRRTKAGAAYDIKTPTIETNNKRLVAVYSAPTTGENFFPDPATNPFTDSTPEANTLPKAENDARGFSLAALETEMNMSPTKEDNAARVGWKYKATNTKVPLTTPVPFFYLAAFGLRNEDVAGTPPVTLADGVNIGTVAFDIPMAASIRLQRNGTNQTLSTLYNSQTTASPLANGYTVSNFGFNPFYGVMGATPDPNTEDVLSVDQSFYQTDLNILRSVFDSRKAAVNFDTEDVLVLRQNNDLLAGTLPIDLPEYRVRALKLENTNLGTFQSTPVAPVPIVIQPISLDIDAYVYAQEGSWFVIPSDYFRTGNDKGDVNGKPVRSSASGDMTYMDLNNDGVANPGEYVDVDGSATPTAGDFADLNRNGVLDPGEAEAALRFVRYNYTINFFGAIVENQTAVVADVKDGAGATLASGAVQDWTNKWAAYSNDTNNNGINDDSLGEPNTTARNNPKWKFITYAYDPSIAINSPGANQLRVPVTDDLLYQQ